MEAKGKTENPWQGHGALRSNKSAAPTLGQLQASCVPTVTICKVKDFSDKMPTFLQESLQPLPDSLAMLTCIINNNQGQEKVTGYGNFRCIPTENIQLFWQEE